MLKQASARMPNYAAAGSQLPADSIQTQSVAYLEPNQAGAHAVPQQFQVARSACASQQVGAGPCQTAVPPQDVPGAFSLNLLLLCTCVALPDLKSRQTGPPEYTCCIILTSSLLTQVPAGFTQEQPAVFMQAHCNAMLQRTYSDMTLSSALHL